VTEKILFIIFSVLAVGGGVGTITRKNVVHALLLLVFTFLNVAAIFFLTQAYFLAVIQILVYAGAIMVLFVFVIMLLNLRTFEQEEQTHKRQKWIALALSILVLAEFVIVLAGITFTSVRGGFTPDAISEAGGGTQVFGEALFNNMLLPFDHPAGGHGRRHHPGQEREVGRRSHPGLGAGRAALARSDRGGGVAAVGATPADMPIPVDWYLYLSAALFIVGAAGVLIRRNLFIMLFSIELMLNAVNINLVGFSRFHENLVGQNFVLFVMAIAAAEAAVGLAIATALFRNQRTLMVDLFDRMKG
jgi:NADH-quinone oxidoreductase subunit K